MKDFHTGDLHIYQSNTINTYDDYLNGFSFLHQPQYQDIKTVAKFAHAVASIRFDHQALELERNIGIPMSFGTIDYRAEVEIDGLLETSVKNLSAILPSNLKVGEPNLCKYITIQIVDRNKRMALLSGEGWFSSSPSIAFSGKRIKADISLLFSEYWIIPEPFWTRRAPPACLSIFDPWDCAGQCTSTW